jgi:hypothetical protein
MRGAFYFGRPLLAAPVGISIITRPSAFVNGKSGKKFFFATARKSLDSF